MRKNVNLSIPKPCQEDWNNFIKTETGGFCNSCQKNVIDFTRMTETEILSFFQKYQGNTCGKFHKTQIKTYVTSNKSKPNQFVNWFKAATLSFPLLLGVKESYGQKPVSSTFMSDSKECIDNPQSIFQNESKDRLITVKGVIKEESGYEIPGVNVVIKGTNRGTTTDLDGQFILKDVAIGDVLIISFIGLETMEYIVKTSDAQVLLNLVLEMSYDLQGEVVIGGVYKSNPLSRLWFSVKSLFK